MQENEQSLAVQVQTSSSKLLRVTDLPELRFSVDLQAQALRQVLLAQVAQPVEEVP